MTDKAGGNRGGLESAPADFIELLGQAILSGIAASVVLALVALGLATTASAQTKPDDAKTGTLLFRPALEATIVASGMRGNLPWSMALTPPPSDEPTGVGALWARAKIASPMDELRPGAGELPQTDTESTLHIVLGLLALAVAGMVVLIGRFIPAGGADSRAPNAEGAQ